MSLSRAVLDSPLLTVKDSILPLLPSWLLSQCLKAMFSFFPSFFIKTIAVKTPLFCVFFSFQSRSSISQTKSSDQSSVWPTFSYDFHEQLPPQAVRGLLLSSNPLRGGGSSPQNCLVWLTSPPLVAFPYLFGTIRGSFYPLLPINLPFTPQASSFPPSHHIPF